MATGAVTVLKQGVLGNMKYGVVSVVGSASYTTAGDALDLNAVLGFTNIYFVDITVAKTTPPLVNYPVVVYDATNKKVQSFSTAAAAAGLTEATAATNFSGLTYNLFVIGS